MSKLKELYLLNNKLLGAIPTQIGSLKSIQKFSMSYNNVKGNVSYTIKNEDFESFLNRGKSFNS